MPEERATLHAGQHGARRSGARSRTAEMQGWPMVESNYSFNQAQELCTYRNGERAVGIIPAGLIPAYTL